MKATTTGFGNTAIGNNALVTNTTGSQNTIVGFAADVTVNNLTNATAIGQQAKVGASNSLVLGGTGANAVNVGIGTTNPLALLDAFGPENSSIDLSTTGGAIKLRSSINSTAGAQFGTVTNHQLNFITNNSGPWMTIAKSGEVGTGPFHPNWPISVRC